MPSDIINTMKHREFHDFILNEINKRKRNCRFSIKVEITHEQMSMLDVTIDCTVRYEDGESIGVVNTTIHPIVLSRLVPGIVSRTDDIIYYNNLSFYMNPSPYNYRIVSIN